MPRQKGTPNTPQSIIDEIVSRHVAGATKRELAAEYEKPFKTIKNMIVRENNKQRREELCLLPRQRGRPRKAKLTGAAAYESEIKRLTIENELLRDFLHLAGRK
jgi:hypothetical protein